MDLKNLKDGIYYIKSIPNGNQIKYLTDKLEDLPCAMTLAQFEQIRYKVAQDVSKYLQGSALATTDEIMQILLVAFQKYCNKG